MLRAGSRGLRASVKRRMVSLQDAFATTSYLVPSDKIVHDRASVEVFRVAPGLQVLSGRDDLSARAPQGSQKVVN